MSSDTSPYENRQVGEANVPFEVPEGWVWTTLGSVCYFENGFAFSSEDYKQEGTPLIRITNISDNTIDLNGCVFIQKEIDDRFVVRKGDLLIALSGATTGKMGIYSTDKAAYLNQRVGNLRIIDSSILCQEYRNIFMYSITETILTLAYGGAQPNISGSVICSFLFPLPPLIEQRRIVTAVERCFSLIDKIEQGKADLQTTIMHTKSKILDLAIHGKLVPQDPNDEPAIELLKRINPKFTLCDNAHYENIPQGWSEIKIGELAQYTNGKAFQPSDWEQSGLPIIRIQNLNDENCKYNYTSIAHEEKYKISNGDLLFAWAASLGVYIWKGNDAWLNQHIFKVKPQPFIDKQYLYYLFRYLISEFYIRSHGSGMVHITKKEFETTIALLPSLSEQRRIVKSIESYYATLDNISAEL